MPPPSHTHTSSIGRSSYLVTQINGKYAYFKKDLLISRWLFTVMKYWYLLNRFFSSVTYQGRNSSWHLRQTKSDSPQLVQGKYNRRDLILVFRSALCTQQTDQ